VNRHAKETLVVEAICVETTGQKVDQNRGSCKRPLISGQALRLLKRPNLHKQYLEA